MCMTTMYFCYNVHTYTAIAMYVCFCAILDHYKTKNTYKSENSTKKST